MTLEEDNKEAIIETKKREEILTSWKPKTQLGRDVLSGKIKDIREILDRGIKIKEPEIVDYLVPNLKAELILIGGRPGKGGGIERTPVRVTAKMHRSGRRYRYSAFVVVGNGDGIVGYGKGIGKEGKIAIEKATRKAKLNLIYVPTYCGSWECGCGENHSIPYKTEGKSGSVRVILLPAPKGIGLAVSIENRKLLSLAGVSDLWIKTFGNSAARYNLVKATFNALKNLHRFKSGD
ncbi:MAG: 30S ribosomal protein S5 [Candidatus Aenigmatarchaeota archaeon]